jgi:radical SAM superfamily enzyme YgiQ (UPF0313 family)
MKIFLAAVNSRFAHSNLALRYMRSSLTEAGHASTLVEFTVNQQLRDVVEEIYLHAPDVLVFSVYIWNGDFVRRLAVEMKILLPHVKIVAGGPELSAGVEQYAYDGSPFDYIITGAGESSIAYLADAAFGVNEKIISKPAPHLDELPFPYNSDDMTALRSRYVYYESSRNCPYRCSYCLSGGSFAKVEYRSLEKVFRELEFFAKHKAGTVKFVDRTFNADRERARALWKHILTLPGETTYHFEIHPEGIEQADLEILGKFPKGKIRLEIGIQTLNEETLAAVNRKMDCGRSLDTVRQLRSFGALNLHLDLIAGLPLDTMRSFQDSFNEVYRCRPDELQLGFLKVLPGTHIRREAAHYNMKYMNAPPYTVYSTDGFTYADILRLEKIENLIDNIKNRHTFDATIDAAVAFMGTPFAFYDKLAQQYAQQMIKTELSDWKKIAAVLIEFLKQNKISHEIIMDLLRWDWIRCGNGGYPELLLDGFIEKVKEDSILHLRMAFEDKNNAIPFDRKSIGKLIFFKSESGIIDDEICIPGKTLAVLKNGERVTYYGF